MGGCVSLPIYRLWRRALTDGALLAFCSEAPPVRRRLLEDAEVDVLAGVLRRTDFLLPSVCVGTLSVVSAATCPQTPSSKSLSCFSIFCYSRTSAESVSQ